MLVKLVQHVWIVFIILIALDVAQKWESHAEQTKLLEDQIPVLETKKRRLIKKQREIKKYLKDVEEAKKKIDLVAEEVEKISRQLPDNIDDTKNLASLNKLAQGLNIKNIFLEPMTEENKEFFVSKKYKVSGEGTYLQFLIFMEKISSNDSLLNVRNFKFVRSKKNQRGRFQSITAEVFVEAYRYNGEYKEDRGIDKIKKEFEKEQKRKPSVSKKKTKKKA